MSTKTKFDYAIEFTLRWEAGWTKDGKIREDGGLNTADGSVTKWGIRQVANPSTDVPNLTKEQAIDIYYNKYWMIYGLDKEELGMSVAMFDTGVNVGPTRMLKWAATVEATKDPAKRLIELRDAHYFNLASIDRTKYGQFLRGWTARTLDLKKYIDIIRLEDQPVLPVNPSVS